ncbi:hypothetical protein J2X69_002418 [Algoriphagus sp. 4150]|uniref:imm11 family protein n=1 Tax=Algoriphagus sp. 4150 TaxID=2817756 RepID=UPI002858264D|nr:DUF1629 domain-containing protein [Algoriphagus sp. 4150]MDR7130071.1 hypothetical protein [Algoriphagus sp. 4150]
MYYTIKHETNTEEIGSDFPQASCLTLNEAHNVSFDAFTIPSPNLAFKLGNRTKLTDVLSQAAISAHGLLISHRFKVLLDSFNIMAHKFYPVTVETGKKEELYFWMHLVDMRFNNKIDYSGSTFYWTKSTFRKGSICLSSYEDYLQQKKENGLLWGVGIDKISLGNEFDKTLDLISSIPFDMGIYVSEKLKTAIFENNVTGIKVKEATNIC